MNVLSLMALGLASTAPLAMYVWQDGVSGCNDGVRYTSGVPQPSPFHRRFCGWPRVPLQILTHASLAALGIGMGSWQRALLLLTLPGAWCIATHPTVVDAPAMLLAWCASLLLPTHPHLALLLSLMSGYIHERGPVFAALYAWHPLLLLGLVASGWWRRPAARGNDRLVGLPFWDTLKVHRPFQDMIDPMPIVWSLRGLPFLLMVYGGSLRAWVALIVANGSRVLGTDTTRFLFWAAPALVVDAGDFPIWALGLHVLSFRRDVVVGPVRRTSIVTNKKEKDAMSGSEKTSRWTEDERRAAAERREAETAAGRGSPIREAVMPDGTVIKDPQFVVSFTGPPTMTAPPNARDISIGDHLILHNLHNKWEVKVLSIRPENPTHPLHIIIVDNGSGIGHPVGTEFDWGLDIPMTHLDGAPARFRPLPILKVGDVVRNTAWQTELDFTVLVIDAEMRKIKLRSVMGGGVFSAPEKWLLHTSDGVPDRPFVLPVPEGPARCGEPVGNTGWLCAREPHGDGAHASQADGTGVTATSTNPYVTTPMTDYARAQRGQTFEEYQAQQEADGPHVCQSCRAPLDLVWVESAAGQRCCSFSCMARIL